MSSLTFDNFNEAESYESSCAVEREDGLQLIDAVAPKRGSKVLDLGCGTGHHSKVLSELVGSEGKVVAIDPDTERLRLARQNYFASNIEYLERSAEDIPGSGYDLVFSNHVLHWCNDHNLVFRQVANKLKSGGIFAFICVEQHSAPVEMFSDELKSALLFNTVNQEVVRNLACSNTFTEVNMYNHQCIHAFDSVHDLIKFFMIHTHGKFDETHFDIAALMSYYGNGKVIFKYPVLTAILSKR